MRKDFRTILIVDDDNDLRPIVSKMVSRMGYDVLSADSGEKGLDLFLKNRIDLVITDFEMPGMNGITLAFQIKQNSPYTAVILMTGRPKADILTRLSNSSVDYALFKPFGFGEVEKSIQKLLDPEKTEDFRIYRAK